MHFGLDYKGLRTSEVKHVSGKRTKDPVPWTINIERTTLDTHEDLHATNLLTRLSNGQYMNAICETHDNRVGATSTIKQVAVFDSTISVVLQSDNTDATPGRYEDQVLMVRPPRRLEDLWWRRFLAYCRTVVAAD